MPQLDPANFSTQLFWLTISFVVLHMVLARFLLPRIQSIFALRSRTIEGDLGQAEAMQSEAHRVQDAYERALAEARAQSDAVITEAKDRIAEVAAGKQAELDKAVEKKLAESEASIQKAKKDVMGKLMPVAAEIAQKIVEIVADHKPSAKEIESAMSGTVKESAA